MPKPTVFISYRRNPDEDLATYLYEKMTSWGVDVFWDIEKLRSGLFDTALKHEIVTRDIFVIILSPQTLESEWVCKELALAISRNKHIVPIMANGFDFYAAKLTPDIEIVQRYHGIPYNAANREMALGKLREAVGAKGRVPIISILAVLVILIGIGISVFSQFFGNILPVVATATPTVEMATATDEVELPTITLTATPIVEIPTTIPTTTMMSIATATIIINETGFPCNGEIVFTTGALSNIVRALPSNTAPSRPPVQQGSMVIITQSQITLGDLWYEIEYGENTGWIRDLHITPINC